MEELIERLNNTLAAKKASWPITIKGSITNEDGSFVYTLKDPLQFDDDGTYLVWLWNFTSWSNFPNVVAAPAEQQNNKFYYSSNAQTSEKEITLPTSLHDVDSYNAFIHRKMETVGDTVGSGAEKVYPANISYDLPTQRIVLTVKRGCKVHFDKDKTWRHRLGFQSKVYGEGRHVAENRADIVETLNIFIETDICYGWSYDGFKTNILYAIVNSQPAGHILVERPNPPIKVQLNKSYINSIRLRFFSDDNKPVTFQGEEFVLNLVIERL